MQGREDRDRPDDMVNSSLEVIRPLAGLHRDSWRGGLKDMGTTRKRGDKCTPKDAL